MPLEILGALVVFGILGIAGLLHLSGRSKPFEITAEQIGAVWHRHFPEDELLSSLIAQSGHAALVDTARGTALLWSFGADTVAKYLGAVTVTETRNGLKVRLPDYAAPEVRLDLTAAERTTWARKLEAI